MQPSYPSADVHAACRLAWASDSKGLLELSLTKDSAKLFSSQDSRGFAPLHYASGSADVTSMLLDSEGTDENIRDENLNTPLHHACFHGNKEVVEVYINHGAALNVHNYLGETPLTSAVAGGFRDIVSLLLASGANPNLKGLNGESALHIAAASGEVAIIEQLLKYGAFVNETDDLGDSPLHWAIRESQVSAVSALLKRADIDVNAANDDGETGLHLAASFGETSIAELLLAAGADSDLENASGFKAAEEAANGGYARLAHLLQPERFAFAEVRREPFPEASPTSKKEILKGFGTSPYAQNMFAL